MLMVSAIIASLIRAFFHFYCVVRIILPAASKVLPAAPQSTPGPVGDFIHDLRSRPGSVLAHPLPPVRAQRAAAARGVARPVAELRRRPAAGDPAGDHPARVR